MTFDGGFITGKNAHLDHCHNSPPFLPYSPRLREILKSYGAALLLIYLEQHYPASQDRPNAPVLVDLDRTRESLQVSSKVFWNHVWMLAVGWRSAKRLLLARQAGREFLTTAVRGSGAYKPYSYLRVDKQHIQLHRNHPRLRQLLVLAGVHEVSQAGALYEVTSVNDHGFSSFRSQVVDEIEPARGRDVAREMVKGLADLSDGRRKAGLKRRFARRSPWSEERRNKFLNTMKARYGWNVDKRAISDVDGESAS